MNILARFVSKQFMTETNLSNLDLPCLIITKNLNLLSMPIILPLKVSNKFLYIIYLQLCLFAPDKCPERWIASGSRCFYFSNLDQVYLEHWIEAEKLCRGLAQGSNLASIRSQAEQDFINSWFFLLP